MPQDSTGLYLPQAEEAILAALMVTPNYLPQLTLQPGDFCSVVHGQLFEAISMVYQEGSTPDMVTVSNALRLAGLGNEAENYLARILSVAGTPSNIPGYAGEIRNAARRRRFYTLGGEMQAMAQQNRSSSEMIATLHEMMLEFMESSQHGLRQIGGSVQEFLVQRTSNSKAPQARPIQLGFTELDRMTGGILAGDLVGVGARPGVGKSAFMGSVALNVAMGSSTRPPKRVVVFSFEMPALQLVIRFLSQLAGIDSNRLKQVIWDPNLLTNEENVRLHRAAGVLSSLQIYIDDRTVRTPNQMLEDVMALHQLNPVDLVCIDYLGRVTPNPRSRGDVRSTNRAEVVGDIVRACKTMARVVPCAVLLLVQLNRALEGRGGADPQMSDFRESGDIEQEVDLGIIITPPHSLAASEELEAVPQNLAELHLVKQRNGPIGRIYLGFHRATTKFVDLGTINGSGLPNSMPPQRRATQREGVHARSSNNR